MSLNDPKEPPKEVAEFYQHYLAKWKIEGWETKLQYVNDEYKLGWFINLYLPGSESYPQIENIPADGTIPAWLLNKLIHTFNYGIEHGGRLMADNIALKMYANAMRDAASIIQSHPNPAPLSRTIRDMPNHLKEIVFNYEEVIDKEKK